MMKWWTCVVLLCVTAALADDEYRIVPTAQGPVRGRKDPSGLLYEFYNIPYATGPTGQEKFKPPFPPPTWTEPFDATGETRVICPQNDFMVDMLPENADFREDCLIANVFVPITTEENLSVLVYVHGGGFVAGYGDVFRGTQFLKDRKDIIMVTFNYRLGIHGFLCLGTEDVPGNAGMKDQVALLRWVQQNIASFGGNPDDVTLGGCSAGSSSVDLLMLSKSAEGLFHRAIPESGGNLAAFTIQRDPVQIAQTYARELNDLAILDNLESIEQFYKTASIELLTSDTFSDRTDATLLFSPCVERDTDGAFLTESPLTILKKGNYKNVPMLYGFANKEGLLQIGFFQNWKHMMNENFSDFLPADLKFETDAEREEIGNTAKRFYFGDNSIDNETVVGYVNFFSDVMFTCPMLRAAKTYVEGGNSQVYLYEYSFVDENLMVHPDVHGADHCGQAFAWLDNTDGTDESLGTPEYQKVRTAMREIWHNFMKTGNPVPVASSLPAWPATGADRSPYMDLGEEFELRRVPLLEERCRFWDDIYARHYLDAVPPVPPHSGAASTAPKNVFYLFVLCILFYLTKITVAR